MEANLSGLISGLFPGGSLQAKCNQHLFLLEQNKEWAVFDMAQGLLQVHPSSSLREAPRWQSAGNNGKKMNGVFRGQPFLSFLITLRHWIIYNLQYLWSLYQLQTGRNEEEIIIDYYIYSGPIRLEVMAIIKRVLNQTSRPGLEKGNCEIDGSLYNGPLHSPFSA